mmetsp:Transcript_64548/g.188844  ORF Transcript_64548/g.188844 Transcript_64548/m.188844 type:complete len:513 (+) Transcript_64548:127-1665(+)
MPEEGVASTNGREAALGKVIEELGFGKAQLRQMCLTGIVYFGFGCFSSMASMVTVSIAAEWHLNMLEQSLLTSLFFLGTAVGGVFSGRIGDRLGRWYPIVISNAVMTVGGFLSAFSPNWVVLMSFRVVTGFAMGFGVPPMCAMLSEISPERWKIPVRSMSDACLELGFMYTALVATMDEPRLQHLHWRRMLMWSAFPGAAGFLSFFFLQESPVFLAITGQDAKAQKVLDRMWRDNRGVNTSQDAKVQKVLDNMWRANTGLNNEQLIESLSSEVAKDEKNTSAMAGYRVIFGRKYRFITVAFCWMCFCINIHFYGGLYAQPQILGTQSETLKPGLQMIMGSFFDFAGVLLAIIISRSLSRKQSLVFGLTCCAVSTWAFGWAGAKHSRSARMECVFQFGVVGFYWVPAISFIIFSQLAVESFPTLCSTTGGSIAFCCGRFGAMAAPMLFENIRAVTHRWQIFCYLSAAFSVLGVMLVAADATASRDPANEDPYETAPCRCKPLADAEAGKGKAQ